LEPPYIAILCCVCKQWKEAIESFRIRNSSFSQKSKKRVIEQLAAMGDLKLLEYFFHPDMNTTETLISNAATNGQINILEWAIKHQFPYQTLCDSAAQTGQLEVLEWAKENCCISWSDQTCLNTIKGGHLECLQWLRENGCPFDRHKVWFTASYHKQNEILNWLFRI